MINTLFIIESGPMDPARRIMLESLVGEDISTFSSREMEAYENGLNHGECYWAQIGVGESGTMIAESDMGDPASVVEVRAPHGTSNRRLLEALEAVIQVLMRVD